MRTSLLSAACIAAWLLCGCADVCVTTGVKADGAWDRRLEFRIDAKSPMGEEGDLAKSFDLPKGEGWTVKEGVEGKKKVYAAERAGKAGEAIASGLVVKTKKGAVALSTEASVREISPGRFEYREVVKWKGEKPKEYLNPDPEKVAIIKAAIPAGLADDARAAEIFKAAFAKYVRRLLGPGDPLMAQLLLHPRLGLRRLKKNVSEDLSAILKGMFGDKIAEPERIRIAGKIVDALELEKTQEKAQSKSPGGPGGEGGAAEDDAEFVPLTFVLKVPGRILESDGETDRAANEVVWDFYAQSAMVEDVVLTATFESKP